MLSKQLKHVCHSKGKATTQTWQENKKMFEVFMKWNFIKDLIDGIADTSHEERWKEMISLGQCIFVSAINNDKCKSGSAEHDADRHVNAEKSLEMLKVLLELSNEELPYYRQVAAMAIRGVLSSFVMYAEENAHGSENVQDTNTKAKYRDVDDDDDITSTSVDSSNVVGNSGDNHKKEDGNTLLSLYKSVEATAHKLLCDPLPRIAQLMCSVVVRSVIAAAQIEHSDVNNSRTKHVDAKLFDLLEELVEHPVLIAFVMALQRAKKCYLVDKLCAQVYLGRENNVKTQESLHDTSINTRLLKKTEEGEEIEVTSTSALNADFTTTTTSAAADVQTTTTSPSSHSMAHEPLLSPSHKNYKKLLLYCNNAKLLTEIICNPAIYSMISANVIHHLTLMHPLVMLNCVQVLTYKHHLTVTAIRSDNNNPDAKETEKTQQADSNVCEKDQTALQPCQLQEKQGELESASAQEKRKEKYVIISTSACEQKNIELSEGDNEEKKMEEFTDNDAELEVHMRLIPFLLKVLHALVHKRQPANVIDVATMFVFGTAININNDINEGKENDIRNDAHKDEHVSCNEKDSLAPTTSNVHQRQSTLFELDLVQFPCSDDDKDKLIQHYFERRPRLVAPYVLQHVTELPLTLQLELKGNMCKLWCHRRKCYSLPSSPISNTSNIVSVSNTSCSTFSGEVSKEYRWLTDLITCGKVRNILECYAHFPPELRALIYEKYKVVLQSSSEQWRRNEQFTNMNKSDNNMIIDESTLFSIPDAARRADEGRRHFVFGDRYFADDHARRISYLSLLPVHEAIALADENEYIHNKEVSIRSAVVCALISGLPCHPHHNKPQGTSKMQQEEQEEEFTNKEDKEKICKLHEIQEEKTNRTESTSDVAVAVAEPDNTDVMKVLQYCMERVNEQDPWKCTVMHTWSELPCKVWKVSQMVICTVNDKPKQTCQDERLDNNQNTNNECDQNKQVAKERCLLSTEDIANKAQHQKEECECTSSSCWHVPLLITFIQKCMSAKDISPGTLQHIALLLLKVLCGLYSTCDHADMTETHNKAAAKVDEKLKSVKQTVLEMWIKLVIQRKTVTYYEKRVLATAPAELISVIFDKLTYTIKTKWLHVSTDKTEHALIDSYHKLIQTLINATASKNTNSNEKCHQDSQHNNVGCTNNSKKHDSHTYINISEESHAIKKIFSQVFSIKQTQSFLHDGMKSFLYTYCMDYTRHYSPHLCVVGLELFCHFSTKKEQVAFIQQFFYAVLDKCDECKEDNRQNVIDENTKNKKHVKPIMWEILLSFVSLPEVKVIIEKEVQGKYLTYILERLHEQEQKRYQLQKNTQTNATVKSTESDESDNNSIEDSLDCVVSQTEVVNSRVAQFACDLRKFVKEHNKGNTHRENVSHGYDGYEFIFTCKYCKYWTAAQQQQYSRTILRAITHRYASDPFAQRELFKLLSLMPDLSLKTLNLRELILYPSASQSSPSLLPSSNTTSENINTCCSNSVVNVDVADTPQIESVNTACISEEQASELDYDKEFVRSLAIQLLGKLYDHESFDLLVELLHVDALVKEAFAALRNRFAFVLQCGSKRRSSSRSNKENDNVEKVFSLITSISNECAKVSVLKELLRYVGSMQNERAFQWLLEYGQKCKELQLTQESRSPELASTATETSVSETSLTQDSEVHSNDSEKWEKLNVDETDEKDSNNSENNKEESNAVSVEESVNDDNDDDSNNDKDETKEVNKQHRKWKQDADDKKYSRNRIQGMHRDVYLVYLSVLINFIDKEEVWKVMQDATECTSLKHQVLICNVICGIADDKIASDTWKRTRYTHLLLQLLQNATNVILQRKDNNNNNNNSNKAADRSKQEAARSIIRTVLQTIIDSRVDGITNTLLYEDCALYPSCYSIMNKHIETFNTKHPEQEVSEIEDDDDDDDDDVENEQQEEELCLLSLKCLLYCRNVPVQKLVEQIINVTDDWELVKRIEQVEEVHDDLEHRCSSTTNKKDDTKCNTNQRKDDSVSTHATAQSQTTHSTTVSKVAIALIDYLILYERQPVLIIHLLLCTQNPQWKWINYITRMHKLDLLHPDVMSKCINLFQVYKNEPQYYCYERNARTFATAHILHYKEELLTLEQNIMRHHTLLFVRRLGVAIVIYFQNYYRVGNNNSDEYGNCSNSNVTDAVNKAERIKHCQDAIEQYRNDKEKWIRDAAMLVRLPKRKITC